MKACGLFASVTNEVGKIIVAEVNKNRITRRRTDRP